MIQFIFIFINSPGDPFTEGFFFMEMGGIYYSICKGIGVLKAEEEESEEPQKAAQREQVESPALSRPPTRKQQSLVLASEGSQFREMRVNTPGNPSRVPAGRKTRSPTGGKGSPLRFEGLTCTRNTLSLWRDHSL